MQESWVLRSASSLMLIDIYMKYHEDCLSGFQVIERTQFCDRVQGKLKNCKSKRYGAHRLMLIDIYMKFCEDSLNGFQVIEWIRFCDRVQGK